MGWNLDQSAHTRAGRVAWGHSGDGPPLVLAHGWPWSSYAWHRVIPALAPYFHVYWYDMPGFGRSEMRAGQATSLDVQGEVFAEMLDHWGLDAPSVWAHDFGGAITLRAQLLGGRRYHRYLLMNVVAMRPWGSEFFEHVGRHVEAFMGLPPHIHRAVVDAYIRGALARPLPDEDQEALVAPWLSEEGQLSFYRQFAQADEHYTAEIEGDFGKIAQPVRVIWGEDDPWIPLARGEALAKAIGCDFTPMKGCEHLPQLEAPEATASLALAYLRAEV
ncbi:pimeloyl-ACP methyl ester carboxylesterase [Litoreibacter ponti]|uniref:Pimeloyl-ACP methyl ester carboxylesterase n=1 Tax=Litoreibacter ponti TaxID=1510457 RepID=A0A2T6BK73_9RHOB|nr:alpha/beta hydrolase [Litoreibacter ponti]PTX56442.1 pimeloyl-ACP methyl ester carboxylesterase [Litoreibacter ponti]